MDAIVVPAGTQDDTMTNAMMTEKYTEHIHCDGKTLNTGDVVCLTSGSFPAKVAFHVVLPTGMNPSHDKDYVLACWSCIQEAISKGLNSLSFPMLGVDEEHNISATFCIAILLRCIDRLCGQLQETSINTLCIVISDEHADVVVQYFDNYNFKSQTTLRDAQPSLLWYWYNDSKQYSKYSKDIADKLTEAKNSNPMGKCYFQICGNSYAVDLLNMTQKNIKTGHTRKVLCNKSSMIKASSEGGACGLALHTQACAARLSRPEARWYYKDDMRDFVPYSSQDSTEIESMFQKHSVRKTLVIDSRTYKFDFDKMKQINYHSNYERDIQRREFAQHKSHGDASSAATGSSPEMEYFITIRGLKLDLNSAKQKITDKLNTLCMTKVVQLPLTSTPAFAQKLTTIARNHSVSSSIREDDQTASHLDSSYRKHMSIEGAEHLVHKAVTEVQEEIIKFQSLTVSAVEYPPEWEPCSTTTVTAMLFELLRYSTEWNCVAQKFQETMPDAEIVSIKRIQNKWLWEKYAQTKKRMHQKNCGVVNELELWHGSRTNAEDIYDSEEGFDMRFSSEGMWGQANYFAMEASYSVKYAHKREDGTKELLLAKVLTGDSFESVPNKALRMPPEKPTTSSSEVKLKQVRYDTVNGVTRNCRVYMTYSNDKAYPGYLVQFSVTPKLSPSSTSSHRYLSTTALTRLKLAGYTL